MTKFGSVAMSLIAASLAFGCDSPKSKENPVREEPAATKPAPPSARSAKDEAKQAFVQRCVACHGDSGAGDGPGAAAIEPKPRAFSDPAWQASVTDEHLKKVIVSGGAAVDKSPLMPGNPDLRDKPEVVAELVKLIRDFKK